MELRDSDKEWQKDAPVLASISKDNPFTVPEGYFNTLSEQLKSRALIESKQIKDSAGFTVPEAYFTGLSQRIQGRIVLESTLSKNKEQGLQLPESYFETLSDRIQARIGKKKSHWLSYAAAACITMVIGSVIYFNSSQYTISRKLSDVSDQEIINYLQLHTTVSDNQFIIEHLNTEELQQVNNDISEQELELYINNTTL